MESFKNLPLQLAGGISPSVQLAKQQRAIYILRDGELK